MTITRYGWAFLLLTAGCGAPPAGAPTAASIQAAGMPAHVLASGVKAAPRQSDHGGLDGFAAHPSAVGPATLQRLGDGMGASSLLVSGRPVKLPDSKTTTVGTTPTAKGLSPCRDLWMIKKGGASLIAKASWRDVRAAVEKPKGDPCKDDPTTCGEPSGGAGTLSHPEGMDISLAVRRVGAPGYWLMKEAAAGSTHAHTDSADRFDAMVAAHIDVPNYERVTFCPDDNTDEDDCTTATAEAGSEVTTRVVDARSGKLLWSAACENFVADNSQETKVTKEGDVYSFRSCVKGHRAVHFTLAHLNTCPAPADRKAALIKRLVQQGRKATRKGDYPKALEHYTEALKLDEDYGPALAERGYAKYKAGDFKGAQADMDDAVVKAPSDPKRNKRFLAAVHFNRGLVAEAMKKPRAARAAYKKSLTYRKSKTVRARLDALGK